MRTDLFRVTSLIIVSMWLITSGLSFAGDPAKMLQEVKSDDQKYAGTWTGTVSPENGDSGQLKYTFIKDEKGKWSGKVNYRDQSLDFKLLEIIESRKLPLRFYLEAGLFENDISGNGGGILENTRHLRDVLRAKGYEVHYREFAGGHDFLSWRGSLADGLLSLARMRATR
jgi:hypothetical protein